jgi:hypothetical protein
MKMFLSRRDATAVAAEEDDYNSLHNLNNVIFEKFQEFLRWFCFINNIYLHCTERRT